ncbi:hybrid sensor histidine kinase/response regulator [Verrucomicrobiales bacterium BCK34]|nr:hybrid sensor histidine kinase/response regulator [Verrucomicrobiales bacterium BCK34]
MKKQFPDLGILYVDDEVKSLKYFEAIFEDIAPIYIAGSPEEGLEVFEANHEHIGLVLSDKKMPNISGLDFLARVREINPGPLRFLVTAFADLDVAVDALNDGLLYSYLSKPWDPADLEHRIIKALGHYSLSLEKERLVREKADAFQHLMMADKAASIGILSTGLNHHMRNALTVMRTFHDLLPYQLAEEIEGQPGDVDFWTRFYDEVGGQIDRMTSMLGNLAEGTRSHTLKFDGEIDLIETVSQTSDLVFGQRADVDVSVLTSSEIPSIEGDPSRIAQMFRLLFDEVNSSLKRGGKVEVNFGYLSNSDAVKVEVIDNGSPLPAKELERVFDPFYVRSDRPEELGTNLMACYLTVFYHGGRIDAKIAEDGRNVISLVLPVKAKQPEDQETTMDLLNRLSVPETVPQRLSATLVS